MSSPVMAFIRDSLSLMDSSVSDAVMNLFPSVAATSLGIGALFLCSNIEKGAATGIRAKHITDHFEKRALSVRATSMAIKNDLFPGLACKAVANAPLHVIDQFLIPIEDIIKEFQPKLRFRFGVEWHIHVHRDPIFLLALAKFSGAKVKHTVCDSQ